MIRNDNEYARALERIEEERARLVTTEESFRSEFTPEQVEALMEPLVSFHQQFVEEIRVYERLKRGDLGDLTNLRGLGRLLIHLRISRGITQRQLAESLEVHESQVSRDERNEYHGIALERATRILDALGAKLLTSVVEPITAQREEVAWAKTRDVPAVSCDSEPQGDVLKPRKVSNADFASAA